MNRFFVSVSLTAALLAALLTGCGAASSTASSATSSTSASSSAASGSESTPATSDSAASAASSDAVSGAAATDTVSPTLLPYSADALHTALNELTAFDGGTAGTSLKSASAAGALVAFAAQSGKAPATLAADAQSWYDGLDEAQRTTADNNWAGVLSTARAIVEDPAQQAELLDNAGVAEDFTMMDLQNVGGWLDALAEILPQSSPMPNG